MFQSRYYLPADNAEQSYKNEANIKTCTYDKDFDVYKNAFILPLRNCDSSRRINVSILEGGVCDINFKLIAGYSRNPNKHNPFMEVVRSYDVDTFEASDESVIYGGIIYYHFGHFLIDSFSRLWFAAKNKDLKHRYAFVTVGNFELELYHINLLNLIGINKERILIVEKPTKFKEVIIPKQSWYTAGIFNPELFKLTWETISDGISPGPHKKIYLSRSKFYKKNLLNEAYFEDFFKKRGFEIVYPEQLSIEEQVSYISGADEIACTYGTLAHLAVFAKQKAKCIYLLRYSMTVGGFQHFIHKTKNIDYAFIDVTMNILPVYHSFKGPFLIGPSYYWCSFINKNFDGHVKINIYDYLDKYMTFFGSYLKQFLDKASEETLYFSSMSGYKFNFVNYLKSLYEEFSPYGYEQIKRSMKVNASPFFKNKIFLYKKSDTKLQRLVKLCADGSIWPIDSDNIEGLKFWSCIRNRLYFLNNTYQPIVEFVAETTGRKHDDKAKYKGVLQAKVSETCTLETYIPGALRNWIIKHTIKYQVNSKRYKKLKRKPDRFFRDSKNPFIRFLGQYYIRGTSTVIFHGRREFKEYFDTHDMKQKVANLKDGMDEDSISYVDNFMKLSRYWYKSTHAGSQRPKHEQLKHKAYREFKKTFEQPFPDILRINPYFFFGSYGLADLPEKVLSSIDGKTIIDGGG